MNEYKLGNGNEAVFLTVDTTTHAMAACKAYLITMSSDGAFGTSAASSYDSNGDILKTEIGSRENLNGKVLRIDTIMEMTTLGTSLEIRKKEYQTIEAKYLLEGGIAGDITFGIEKKIHNKTYTKFYTRVEIFLNA
jgi:hypothetical protein